jgi:hypothetical protein
MDARARTSLRPAGKVRSALNTEPVTLACTPFTITRAPGGSTLPRTVAVAPCGVPATTAGGSVIAMRGTLASIVTCTDASPRLPRASTAPARIVAGPGGSWRLAVNEAPSRSA